MQQMKEVLYAFSDQENFSPILCFGSILIKNIQENASHPVNIKIFKMAAMMAMETSRLTYLGNYAS